MCSLYLWSDPFANIWRAREPCHVQKMREGCQQVATSCLSECSQRSAPLELDDENPLLPVGTKPQLPALQNRAAILFQPALCLASLRHSQSISNNTLPAAWVVGSVLPGHPERKRLGEERGREKSFFTKTLRL